MKGVQLRLYIVGAAARRFIVYGLPMLLLLAACRPGAPPPATPPFIAAQETVPPDVILTSSGWEGQGVIPTVTMTSTATPAQEITPASKFVEATPTATAGPAAIPAEGRRISPDMLLPGISWGGGGGGSCSPYIPDPTIILIATESDGYHQIETDQFALGGFLTISGCGFPPSEMATYTFRLPDGSVDSSQVAIDEYGDWYVEWWSLPGEPLGEYGFDFVSSAGLHTVHFTVHSPIMPVMTGACNGVEAALVMTGFVPGEEVLLGRYVYALDGGFAGDLVGYEYVLIGPDGTAVVNPPPEDAFFVAIGQNVQTFTTYDYDADKEITYQASVTNALTCLP
jgi:hypothetical protein